MKYEFHVGDYVETKDGGIGYISKMETLSNGHTCIYVYFTDGKIYPYDVIASQLSFRFNRVGRYDFTEEDKINEIKPLPEDYIRPYAMHMLSLEEHYIIDIGKISKKVNELVEAVNELNNKIN